MTERAHSPTLGSERFTWGGFKEVTVLLDGDWIIHHRWQGDTYQWFARDRETDELVSCREWHSSLQVSKRCSLECIYGKMNP